MTIETIQIDESTYQIQKTKPDGKVLDAEKFVADKALDMATVGRAISAHVRTANNQRLAWLSFLGEVYKSPRMDGFIGSGNLDDGKISKEFKDAVRRAEEETIRAMVESGSIKLPVQAKATDEQRLGAFLSEIRADKNYSNAKSNTSRYVAFVGKNIVTESGHIVPVPVQKAQVDALLAPKGEDETPCDSKLKSVEEWLGAKEISSTDAIDALARAKAIVLTLQGVVNKYAELATHHAQVRTQGVEQQVAKIVSDVSAPAQEEALM